MFTGIIEQTGVIKALSKNGNAYRLTIYPDRRPHAPALSNGLNTGKELDLIRAGDSVSVNGVCLTAVDIRKNRLTFDVTEQTFRNTSFCYCRNNDVVNMERAVKAQSRMEGHFVLGHIDSVQRIKHIKKTIPYLDVAIAPDDKIYAVKKGSIAIDGVSLTIAELYEGRIRAYLIPFTLENTGLKYKKAGDPVNIEFDILGKYIYNKTAHERMRKPPVHSRRQTSPLTAKLQEPLSINPSTSSGLISEKFLKDKGFI